MTFTGYKRIDAVGDNTGRYIDVPETLNYRQLLGNTAIAISTVPIDRSKVKVVKMRSVYYGDFVCWLEILKEGHIAHGLN